MLRGDSECCCLVSSAGAALGPSPEVGSSVLVLALLSVGRQASHAPSGSVAGAGGLWGLAGLTCCCSGGPEEENPGGQHRTLSVQQRALPSLWPAGWEGAARGHWSGLAMPDA